MSSVRTEAVAAKPSRSGVRRARLANMGSAVEKTRGALTALNLHFAGVALLALLNVYLLVHMAYLWQTARSQNAEALASQRVQLKTAQIAAAPLDGLDAKLAASTDEADKFYMGRLPYAMSQVLTRFGGLAKKQNAKLTRVQYGYSPLFLDGTANATGVPSVTEVRMDASLTGDYKSLVQLVNDLERDKDKSFFLITGVALTGQQSGAVSLRMKLTTYLRPAQGDEKAEALPAANDQDGDESADAPAGGSGR